MSPEQGLKIARDAYSASTTYVDANFRKQWEDALRMFQNKHALDSKYNSEAYKFRSRLFRPKTRSVIRKNEAAAAAAFFSNIDVVNLTASNEKDPKQVFGSQLYKELLQYRLTKSIPWFMTLIGGFQDALTVGVVCSYQHWMYREANDDSREYYMDDEAQMPIMGIEGGPLYQDQRQTRVLMDKPSIELLPVETLRIDKGASWTDPVNSSPYLIHLVPMYLGDVKEMGHANPKTGGKGWDIPEDSKLQAATQQAYDSTRQTREGNREDSKDGNSPINDFSIVWVHKNIARKGGEDFCWYTLGIEHMLSDPKPLVDTYFHGERPYVMGCAVIETHKPYPSGYPELGKELQKEANEVVNSRMDNVKLVMNKRYIVKRGAQVDLKSLVRNVPGSITLANDPEKDVHQVEFNDVTASAYAEQDRINVDMDGLLGDFSAGSVATNRKLNETVGGMALMSQGANQVTEYTIRTFTETWVEPVLRQLVKLEKHYETDPVVMDLMGKKFDRELRDEDFDTDVELSVNVGMGATDPMMRLNKLLSAARAYAEIAAMPGSGLNKEELGKEVFSAVGFRDGGRFLDDGNDPRIQEITEQAKQAIQQLQQQLQQAEQAAQSKQAELQMKYQAQIADQNLDQQQAQAEFRMEQTRLAQELMLERQANAAKLAAIEAKWHTDIAIALGKADTAEKIAKIQAEAKIEIAAGNAEAQRRINESNARNEQAIARSTAAQPESKQPVNITIPVIIEGKKTKTKTIKFVGETATIVES